MERFCRTCLHSIPRGSMFFQLDGEDRSAIAPLIKSQLQECIPEVRVGIIKDPILCTTCLNDLTSAYKFKSKCLETEKQVLKYVLHADTNTTYVDINLLVKTVAANSMYTLENYRSDQIDREKNVSSWRKNLQLQFKNIESPPKWLNSSIGKGSIHTDSSCKVGDPFSRSTLSKDDLNASIIAGIKKDGATLSSHAIETAMGDYIDIEDTYDEPMPEIVLPNGEDIIPSEFNPNEICVEIDVENCDTVAPANLSLFEMLPNINNASKNKKNKRKRYKRNTNWKIMLCKSTNRTIKTLDNSEKIDLQLPSTSNRNTSDIEMPQSNDMVKSHTNEPKLVTVIEEVSIYPSLEDYLENEFDTVNTDSDSSNQLIPPTNHSNANVKIKEEFENFPLELSSEINIKEEIIVKEEPELDYDENKCETPQSECCSDDEEDESMFFDNSINDQMLLESNEESTTSSSSDNFSSTPYPRACPGQCYYSCAVCGYSSHDETVLVAHAKVHGDRNSYQNDFGFRGFTSADLITGCKNCNYPKTSKLLRWLQTKILMPNCDTRFLR